MHPFRSRLAVVAASALLVSGCASLGADDSAPATSSATSTPSQSASGSPSEASEPTATETPEDPDTPSSWGPTLGEIEDAIHTIENL